VIHLQRSTLVRCLLAHDEDGLVERVPLVTDEELKRIGERADHYAFSSEHAKRYGSVGTTRAVSLAAVDVLEGASRELHRKDGQRRGPAAEEQALRRLGFAPPPRRGPSPSYRYIESRCAYCEFGDNVFERMVEWHREIWIGTDRSGLIRSSRIKWSFFTEQQRTRWEATPHPEAAEDLSPGIHLFAPGRIGGRALTLAKLPTDRDELAGALEQQRDLSVRGIGQLMGEALVPVDLRRALYEVAAALPGAEILADARDELGRVGDGVARVEHGLRRELIFDPATGELLACRDVMVDPTADYASPGALVGWTCYLSRDIFDALPRDLPPVPGPP
jgi:hypothetical protein